MNMVIAIKYFPVTDKSGVIPLLNPTVLYAETASNSKSEAFIFGSIITNRSVTKLITRKDSIIKANALLIEISGISRLLISILFFPLVRLNALRSATVKVLVLIPLPVEAGDAPTHIKKMISRSAGRLTIPISIVLKPAVRGVAAPKKAVIILPYP